MERQIKFIKWKSPVKPNSDNTYHSVSADEYDPSTNTTYPISRNSGVENVQPVLMTSIGTLPLYNIGNDIIEFWIGHTNFKITKDVATKINRTDGVETFEVYTPYRFRIGIARLFQAREVMSNITNSVKSPYTSENTEGIDAILNYFRET